MTDTNKNKATAHVPPEQVKYANLLFWGAWIAIAIMLITYILYVSGAVEPYIPLRDIPKYWTMPVHEYVENANIPTGWGWTSLLAKGDFLNFLGIVLLAGMTVICFLVALLPAYVRQKDKIYLGIVIVEVVVLTVAASGILGGGGH